MFAETGVQAIRCPAHCHCVCVTILTDTRPLLVPQARPAIALEILSEKIRAAKIRLVVNWRVAISPPCALCILVREWRPLRRWDAHWY